MCNSCISIFLAQVVGLYVFFMSLAMLVHHQRFKKIMNEFLGHAPSLTLTGGLGLILGLLILSCHNVWVSDWPVLITLIGWLVLIQALMRLFFPDSFVKMSKDLMKGSGYSIWCWIWLLLGIYLVWVGFSS